MEIPCGVALLLEATHLENHHGSRLGQQVDRALEDGKFIALDVALDQAASLQLRGFLDQGVREKLSRTIAQIRELAADEDVGYGDADAIKDEIAASVRDGDDDVEEERATTPSTEGGDDFFERDAAVSDAGWSEGQSLADDAYRTALWLIESAGEDGPQDVDEIVDLLERARRLCPESRPDAVARIDALLASMRLQS